MAAPVLGPDDGVAGAVSLVVVSRGADVARLASIVRAVSLGLSRRVTAAWEGLRERA